MKYVGLLLLNLWCILRKLVQKQALHQFKLADLAQLYLSRMKQLCVTCDKWVNTTRLKQRLLILICKHTVKGGEIKLVLLVQHLAGHVSKRVTVMQYIVHELHK